MKDFKKITKMIAVSFAVVVGASVSAPHASFLSSADSSVQSINVALSNSDPFRIPEIDDEDYPSSQKIDLVKSSQISKSVSEAPVKVSEDSEKKENSKTKTESNKQESNENSPVKTDVEKDSSRSVTQKEKKLSESESKSDDGYWVTTTTTETYYPPSSNESNSSQTNTPEKSNLSLPKPSKTVHKVPQSPSPSVSSNGFKIEDTVVGFLADTESVPCDGLYEYGRSYSNFYTREIGCEGSQIYLDLQPGEKISVDGIGYVMTGSQTLNYYRDGMDDVNFNGSDLYIQTCYPNGSGDVRIVSFRKI